MKAFIFALSLVLTLGAFANEKYTEANCKVLPGNYVGWRYADEGLVEKTVRLIVYKKWIQFFVRLEDKKTGKTKHDQSEPTSALPIVKKTATNLEAELVSLEDAYPSTQTSISLDIAKDSWEGTLFYDSVSFSIRCDEIGQGEYEE